ncbi:hypothetical protein [Puniceibacterium sp. IMCC21224]|uniref:hypothetical protein n=1 Tax=Puniceibacterium sp. IMCC21224 TaxID=1618204 RepID=UPI00064D9086|nr:hypothetical protein [Puniceibacterium sp. IMCC21224]KMK63994.1 hypothetical protein IMCC21224_1652 [Puniceibacterium sp. IMCC21224]
MHILRTVFVATMLMGFGAGAALAADPVQQHNSNAVWFENWVGLTNATLVVAAPNGKMSTVYAESGTPVFELDRAEAQDGVYRFELRAATDEKVEIVNQVDNGRGDSSDDGTMAKPYYSTGFFVVERGVIITPEEIKEEDG